MSKIRIFNASFWLIFVMAFSFFINACGGNANSSAGIPSPTARSQEVVASSPTPAPSPSVYEATQPTPTADGVVASPSPTPAQASPANTPPKESSTKYTRTMYVDGIREGYVGVNLRARPSTESQSLLVIKNREPVRTTKGPMQGADGNLWFPASYNGKEGYILATLLSAQRPAPPPVRLIIKNDRLDVDAAVEYVGLTPDGAMDVPKKWEDVAWYRLGPVPGQQGNAVIAGHLDSTTGPAVFWKLKDIRIGDVVSVIDEDGHKINFKVTKIQSYFDEDAPLYDIFGPTDKSRLNLITCDGSWDPKAKRYDKKLVVFTEKIS
ncbi:peptidase C60 sortase A and B [Thermobaculum terrenum ATCC BAA-798]|uniref:Peptidase C60 sortase A and B n=1 Tax=Thermobaculum terrenum (strain ATCC BAA-798 / CCMEE 7001 / YNP1) TaxID=525904 RepID=D1CEX9_THET1|nr:sortase [Thermobaculum terrenum]ACZ41485.1 peptidase C60 sortase A and B [Thermobaculum terrenum ATCC BAA-798]